MRTLLSTFVVILSLASSLVALAQEGENTGAVPPVPPMPTDHTSAGQRVGKQYMAVASPIGYGPNNYVTQGIEVGLYTDSTFIVSAEITGNDLFRVTSETYQRDIRSYGLLAKLFLGNSLYLKGGINFRSVVYKDNALLGNDAREFSGSSTALSLAVGNQWQWRNFTLGCDWIGYALPVSSEVSSEHLSATRAGKQQIQDDENWYLKNGTPLIGRLYLGASF